jgi:8-oxo-dGTP pyrophosphatase MutT (NUDIX family)
MFILYGIPGAGALPDGRALDNDRLWVHDIEPVLDLSEVDRRRTLPRREPRPEPLIRELRAEVGVTPTGMTYLASIRDPSPSPVDPATYQMYAVTEWIGGEPCLVGDEHTQLEWFSLPAAASLEDLALPQYRALFDAVRIRVAGASSQ